MGQGAPHATASPSGQTTGSPAAHDGISQFWVPAVPAGQSTTQTEPAWQVVWQGPLWQAKWHVLPGPQVHSPFAHTPSHRAFDPTHMTWHGGAPQENVHDAPSSHVHDPFAQVAEQADALLHSTWHGGAAQPRVHCAPAGQTQVPFEQSLETLELHARAVASTGIERSAAMKERHSMA